jgi:FixJ family two-component response regulator
MLSAHGNDEARRQSLDACATAFLEKPVRISALVDAVRRALPST